MDAGTIGGIVGSVVGLTGGIIGTYFSIKNTNGPRERALVIRFSVVMWCLLTVFLAGLLLLPAAWKWMMWIPYAILLPLSIRTWNRRQFEIRNEEARLIK